MNTNVNQQVNNCTNRVSGSLGVGAFVRGLAVALMTLALTVFASAQGDTSLKFKGGIGVIPVSGVSATTGLPTLNVVRGVNPAGPWRIAALDAVVTPDGHILVKGRGLLLAAGSGVRGRDIRGHLDARGLTPVGSAGPRLQAAGWVAELSRSIELLPFSAPSVSSRAWGRVLER